MNPLFLDHLKQSASEPNTPVQTASRSRLSIPSVARPGLQTHSELARLLVLLVPPVSVLKLIGHPDYVCRVGDRHGSNGT